MVSPGGKLKPGRRVTIAPGFDAEILEVTERRTRIVRLESELPLDEAIERHGHVPLPPYIERPDASDDAERYQTVFAREKGSVAAPTAGLHFTPELLSPLEPRGVATAEVLLHVGAGTFKPVEVDDPAAHVMHEEWYRVSPESGASDQRPARAPAGACGRSARRPCGRWRPSRRDDGRIRAGEGETRIFIRPGHRFRAVDRMVTNFHLPRSTLIMLVAAFAGYELTMRAYDEAVAAAVPVLFLRRRDGDHLASIAADRSHPRSPPCPPSTSRSSTEDGAARAGVFTTPHGRVDTPAFMAGRHARHRQGARPRRSPRACGAQMILGNAYHLHLRPGDDVVRELGGLHALHGLGRADPHRLGRLSSLLIGGAAHGRRRTASSSAATSTDRCARSRPNP